MSDTPMTDPDEAADDLDDDELGVTDEPDTTPPGESEDLEEDEEVPEDAGDPAI